MTWIRRIDSRLDLDWGAELEEDLVVGVGQRGPEERLSGVRALDAEVLVTGQRRDDVRHRVHKRRPPRAIEVTILTRWINKNKSTIVYRKSKKIIIKI